MTDFRVTRQAALPKDIKDRKRAALKRAAYDGLTDKELRYVRKCKRQKRVPRLGTNPSGGTWGL